MTIQLTADGLRKIFPRAPEDIISDVAKWQRCFDAAGITHTRTRLSYCLANVEHECAGFTIKNLTENINYTADGAAKIWPRRFPPVVNGRGDPEAVRRKYGTQPGWQLKMFDDVYGNRMGNRPGTHDGSLYIGRGGPQWTGRDGYAELERRTKLPAVAEPAVAARHDVQPEVIAAFWSWKNLNPKADVGDFKGAVRAWNGGQIGMADRKHQMAGNDPIIARLANVDRIMPEAKALPGSPPTPVPPKDVVDEATKRERTIQKTGAGGAVAGGAGEATKSGTEVPATPLLSPFITYTMIGAGVAVVIVAAVLIARKRKAVIANWF